MTLILDIIPELYVYKLSHHLRHASQLGGSSQLSRSSRRRSAISLFAAIAFAVASTAIVDAQQQPNWANNPNFNAGTMTAPQIAPPANAPGQNPAGSPFQRPIDAANRAAAGFAGSVNAAANVSPPAGSASAGIPGFDFGTNTGLGANNFNTNNPGTSGFDQQVPAGRINTASPPVRMASTDAQGTLSQPVTPPLAEQDPVNLQQQGNTTADEGAEASGDDLGDHGAQVVEGFNNELMLAVKGDTGAQVRLATDYLLPIFLIIGVMIVANMVGNRLQDAATRLVSSRVDATLGQFAGKMAKLAVMAVTAMGLLGYFGVETTSIAAAVAALGFAVGMALQGTLSNFASGIALLIFRPFNVGDYIVLADGSGTVEAIGLFTTTINTPDNRHIIIPNDGVFGSKIENWSHNSSRRVDVMVGVSYEADMTQTRQVLMNAISDIQGAASDPGPSVYLNELNASSVDWICRVWCRPQELMAVKERVTESAKRALDQHNIGIPFPQLDLHVVTPAAKQKLAA